MHKFAKFKLLYLIDKVCNTLITSDMTLNEVTLKQQLRAINGN